MTVDSLLLSYIDVRHRGFLLSGLTIGEARDLGPRRTRVGSLVPVRDESIDIVFQGHVVHISVEEPHMEVQAANQVEVEPVDSSGANVENAGDEMVVHRNMTANWFLPGGRLAAQQQIQGRDQLSRPKPQRVQSMRNTFQGTCRFFFFLFDNSIHKNHIKYQHQELS